MTRFSSVALAATAAALTVVAAPAARADVKIVSKNVVTGAPNAAAPGESTATTYYKGAKVRTEAGRNVTIYDAATDKQYRLDTLAKTYRVSSLASAMNSGANSVMSNMEFTTSGVKVDAGGKTKQILGKTARNYIWTANIGMKMKARALPKNSGANGLGAAPPQTMAMTISLRGEQWTTEAVKLPARSMSSTAMMANFGNRIPGMKPLAEKLSKIKGVTLQSTVTQSFSGMTGIPGAPQSLKPITMTTQTVSMSEAPLPDSLFRVPAGYKMVKAATPGAMGGAMSRP